MLEVSGLRAGYGRIPILHGVGFRVAEGETVGVLGHNGMGKTTLIKALMGVVRPTAGRVAFRGADVTREPPYLRARRGMGYVPQGREIFPLLTVKENLETGFAPLKRRDRTVPDQVFELFPVLADMLARRGGDLSGGQQQQLAIARALVTRPRLLALDEPTEGIQPSIIKDIGRAVRHLKEAAGIAILLVEQYLDFARELADRVYVMDRGAIVHSGPAADLADASVRRHLTV
jgi:urea transport system ATP-binding protein